MRFLQIAISGLLIYFSADALHSQTVLQSLDDISAYGSENNLDYRSSLNSVLKAKDDVPGILLLENSSVSASGTYNDNTGAFGFTSKVDIPVIEQLTLSGTLDQNLSGSASVTLSPLSHSGTRARSQISYDSAVIDAEQSRISAENSALTAALNRMTAERELEAQKIETELNKTKYQDDKVRFDLGELTFDDLQDSLLHWSESRVSLTESEKNYRDAETALYSELGAARDDVTVTQLSVDDLKSAVEAVIAELDPDQGDYMKNSQYRTAVLNRMSAAVSLKNTWAYEPDLKAGASVNFDDQGISGVSASVTFTFSLDDIQTTGRKISQEELAIATAKEQQSRNEAELQFSQILDTIDSSSINVEIAGIEMDQTSILLSEAELLFKSGDVSSTDLEETRLSFQKSENALFKALADQYLAWCSLKEYL